MSHAYFPEDVPSEDILNKLLATERLVQGSMVTRCIVKVQGEDHEINIPGSYFNHMQCFMWRESAIRVVLKHANQLELQEDLANMLHKVLCQKPTMVEQGIRLIPENRILVQDLDWKAYDNKLGHLWSGVHTRFIISDRAENNMQFLKTLHDHMKVFYDPIVAEDTDFGYTFKEHLPVEDPDQEEGWDQEGQEQDDAMSQEV
ncbi:hypothetical protein EDC04DRAFT_2905420 [Pisolithus marmoratus]|nr:hypothetical protein EDC04DRAFT_2905420 [Pisolithus marmoratus]